MKQQIVGILGLGVACASIGLQLLQKPSRIAYAETSVILSEFKESIKAKKQFEGFQKEWDLNLRKLNDSLTSTMDRMKQGYDKANTKGKDSLRADLQRRNDDLQRYTNAVKKMSQDKERELMDPVIKKVNGFLSQWGTENGYDMIFGTLVGGNILQANPKLNLTVRILKDINSMYDEPSSPVVESKSKLSTPGSGEPKVDSGANPSAAK